MLRRLRTILAVAVSASVAGAVLAACDSGSAPESEPADGSNASGSQSPSGEPTPEPTAYDDQQLTAALPRTAAQLRAPVTGKCLDLAKACSAAGAPGVAFVQGGDGGGPGGFDVAVHVFRGWDADAWTGHVEDCPQGKFEQPLKYTPEYGEGSYNPGERGTSRRTDWTVGSWTGFVCDKTLVYLWPKNETSERQHSVYAFLHNGHHLLRVDARTPAETRRLASEYLDRLEAAPSAG